MKTRYFAQLPKAYVTYPKILLNGLKKRKSSNQSWHCIEYVVEPFYIDPKQLQQYNQICKFNNDGTIPSIYFLMLSQRLQMDMMLQVDLSFPMWDLQHLSNTITQYQKLSANLKYSLSCGLTQCIETEQGQILEFLITVKWQQKTVVEAQSRYICGQRPLLKQTDMPQKLTKIWQLTQNTTRCYAMVTGDFITTKLFGWQSVIAHDMWLNAIVMSELALPAAYHLETAFQAPLALPSQLRLMTTQQNLTTEFTVKTAKTHMIGKLTVR